MCCSREVKGSVSEERTLVLRLGNSEVKSGGMERKRGTFWRSEHGKHRM